jgi:hypothetical protein
VEDHREIWGNRDFGLKLAKLLSSTHVSFGNGIRFANYMMDAPLSQQFNSHKYFRRSNGNRLTPPRLMTSSGDNTSLRFAPIFVKISGRSEKLIASDSDQ